MSRREDKSHEGALATARLVRQIREKALRERMQQQGLSIHAGNLLRFEDDSEISIVWLVLTAHSSIADLFYALPGDDFPLLGVADLAIDESECFGPLHFRLSQGEWLERAQLEHGECIGFVSEEALAELRRGFVDYSAGENRPTEEQLETEDDPEYAAWLDDLAAARDDILERLAAPGPLVWIVPEWIPAPAAAQKSAGAGTRKRRMSAPAAAPSGGLMGATGSSAVAGSWRVVGRLDPHGAYTIEIQVLDSSQLKITLRDEPDCALAVTLRVDGHEFTPFHLSESSQTETVKLFRLNVSESTKIEIAVQATTESQ